MVGRGIAVQVVGGGAKRRLRGLGRAERVFVRRQLENLVTPRDTALAALVERDLRDPGLRYDLRRHRSCLIRAPHLLTLLSVATNEKGPGAQAACRGSLPVPGTGHATHAGRCAAASPVRTDRMRLPGYDDACPGWVSREPEDRAPCRRPRLRGVRRTAGVLPGVRHCAGTDAKRAPEGAHAAFAPRPYQFWA